MFLLSLDAGNIIGYIPSRGYTLEPQPEAQNLITNRWWGRDGKIDFMDIRTGISLHTFEYQNDTRPPALSPDGSLLAIVSQQGIVEVFETGIDTINLPEIVNIESELAIESDAWQSVTMENVALDVPSEWFVVDEFDYLILSSSADFTRLYNTEQLTTALNDGEVVGVFSVYELGTVPESDANYQITSEMTGQTLADATMATISEVIVDTTSYASHIYINSITHTMLNGRDAALVDVTVSMLDRFEPIVTARLQIYFTFVDGRIVLLALASEYSQFENHVPTFRAIAESISSEL